MKKLTKRLLVFTAAIAMLTGTVSAANYSFETDINLGGTYTTKAIVKDDSEGKAYITTNSTGVVPDEYNAISAWVVDSKGTKITNSIYLKSNTRKTATYYGGYNLPGSYYNLKVHYSYNPQLVPQKTHVNIRWCP